MASRRFSTAISLAVLLGFSSALCAQRATTPTLEEILDRLEENLNRYDAGVPSFFCDEHALSSHVEPGVRDQNTVIDSVFRLKRIAKPDHTTSLAESREVHNVDGKPATSQRIDVPSLPSGAFEGGLAVVSRNQSACMSYALQRINKGRSTEPYVVRFTTALTQRNSAECLLQENSKGRVFIDPATLQIVRLE
ncbi:MAG: hypothetical protein WCC73_10015, partial [Terracidiphilus sp.]